ncbi:Prostasin [Oryzias melastigma]|uniref:Prostasin n=2 Tax=Oryzias melastigma TaxID=30732 RepID=A0A834FHZ9_ORYME|nr:Prostasin [Oryzias melastigma]
MALQQFVSRFTLLTLLLCSGGPPVVATGNSTFVDNGSPETSPWMVYFYINSELKCVGSLITDQWVLAERFCSPRIGDNSTEVVLGIQNRLSDNPNAVKRNLVDSACNSESIQARVSEICFFKLSSPVSFTNDIQAIPLASNMSTFYNNTSIWGSVFETGYTNQTFESLREVKASIVSNDQCKFLNQPIKMVERERCVQLEGSSPCQTVEGSPLLTKVRCQWVLLGIHNFMSVSCTGPVIFTSVSPYQEWIHKTISGMRPTFVTVDSTGSDKNFTCSTEISAGSTSTTATANTMTTTANTTPTTTPTTTTTMDSTGTTTTTTTTRTPTTTDDSIFSGCDNLIHFLHFFSLCSLALFLHVLFDSSEM